MRILTALIAILLLVAAACGGGSSDPAETSGDDSPEMVSAQALLADSGEAFAEVDSMHSDYTISITVAGESFEMAGDMDLEFPGRARMTMSVAGDVVDFLIYGDRFYMNIEDEWSLVDLDELGINAAQFEQILSNRGVFDYSAFTSGGIEAIDRGVAQVDGKDARHITMEMTNEIFTEDNPGVKLFDPSIVDTVKDAFRSGSAEVWIDEETGYPLRATIETVIEMQGQEITTVMDMTFSDFNEDLDIPDEPEDAEPL